MSLPLRLALAGHARPRHRPPRRSRTPVAGRPGISRSRARARARTAAAGDDVCADFCERRCSFYNRTAGGARRAAAAVGSGACARGGPAPGSHQRRGAVAQGCARGGSGSGGGHRRRRAESKVWPETDGRTAAQPHTGHRGRRSPHPRAWAPACVVVLKHGAGGQ